MIPVSVLVATRNEAPNLERTLQALAGLADEIHVIDSESSDGTVEIAQRHGARVATLPYKHGTIVPWILDWALKNLQFRNEWILIIEADQRPDAELRRALEGLFARPAIEEDGFYLRRKQVFRGQWIRFGGYGGKRMLKLFRRGKGELDPKEEDTRVYVQGRVGTLDGWLVEENAKEEQILFYLEKHLRYAEAFAREELARRESGLQWKLRPRLFGTPDERTLWLKSAYYRSPLYLRPWVYFIYRYFFLLGFLDGKQGFIFHFLQAYWFRLVIDVRLEELLREKQAASRSPRDT
jgi:glycosyltransferase involved in cell wall biosynthesis